jgi:hypothetical protein
MFEINISEQKHWLLPTKKAHESTHYLKMENDVKNMGELPKKRLDKL